MILTDQIGREVEFADLPQRIISCVPSITELLFDLGLADRVVGVTQFCVHPLKAKSKARIGGTKNIHQQKVVALKPDLILANKEENEKDQIESLACLFPVYLSDVFDISTALSMIRDIGILTDTSPEAIKITDEISFKTNINQSVSLSAIRVLYLIWKDPYMSMGGDTFISNMLSIGGFINVCGDQIRYPQLSREDISALNPDVIMLSSEPFPFRREHQNILQLQFPQIQVILVDGEMFSWYGSRMSQALDYISALHINISSLLV